MAVVLHHFHLFPLEPMCILVEYAPYGDLLGYLRACKSSDGIHKKGSKEDTMIILKRRLNYFARDIACGMEFLARYKVIFLSKLIMIK